MVDHNIPLPEQIAIVQRVLGRFQDDALCALSPEGKRAANENLAAMRAVLNTLLRVKPEGEE